MLTAAKEAVISGQVLDVSYRMPHKNGTLVWIHLNGRRMGPLSEKTKFYAVFTGMSAETRLFQSITNETADGIYVFDRENYELLYVNESRSLFAKAKKYIGQKCYEALHGRSMPCDFCPLKKYGADGKEYEMCPEKDGNVYSMHFKEMDWNGIAAYVGYVRDITKEVEVQREKERLEREEQVRIRQKYNDLLLQHYRASGPNTLILGHCNVTRNEILDIIDHTGAELLKRFGTVREEFFQGIGSLIPDPEQRKIFMGIYLNKPAMEAYEQGMTERRMECFVQMPEESRGRYVEVIMSLVTTPDSGDVTGILTVTDITRQTISDRILHQISVTGYDYVMDVDIRGDAYRILSFNGKSGCLPAHEGCYSDWIAYMSEKNVVPRDRELYKKSLSREYIAGRLKRTDAFSFAISSIDAQGDIRTKKMTISNVDPKLGRICLTRADITDSVREQQALLHVIAYTFELAGFIDISGGHLTLYTRETVLPDLPPYYVENYEAAIARFVEKHAFRENLQEEQAMFRIGTMAGRLAEKPNGYDFLFPWRQESAEGERYKQINVMWGDASHKTICIVRADVTDMLAAERQTKKELENALALAEEANRAKSDFLSAMSHDIRTPMNAIMGMTTLAMAHKEDEGRVADCLEKISVSSRHLLSLVNDILDMSKIECYQIKLNRMKVCLSEQLEQLTAILAPQAGEAGVDFQVRTENVVHDYFYGDALRINQILINLLSNAVKYTPEGGSVEFLTEETANASESGKIRYRFTVRDTGIGMSEEFLKKIFEPFSRSRNTEYVEGTGLGLSITKGLVDLMGGTITVNSRVRQGSVFQVELEFEPAEAWERSRDFGGRSQEDTSYGKLLEGKLFLIAEDNVINAEILCELLKMYGAETVVRENGVLAAEAFSKAQVGTYDAILMDVRMPQMDGYQTTRVIRAMDRPDAGSIPIIAMTANAFAEDVQAALDAGMNAHIAKPVDVGILIETLKKFLGGEIPDDGRKRPD